MSRSSDLAVIVRALDRAAQSDASGASGFDAPGESVRICASTIVQRGDTCERFSPAWTAAGARAVVLAHARNAPRAELRAMARQARKQIEWWEWWDREGWAEAQGWVALLTERATRKAARS